MQKYIDHKLNNLFYKLNCLSIMSFNLFVFFRYNAVKCLLKFSSLISIYSILQLSCSMYLACCKSNGSETIIFVVIWNGVNNFKSK